MSHILATIALILLTMVGYSSGVVLTKRQRMWEPSVIDLLVIAVLWGVVFWLRPGFGRWTMLAIAVLIGLVTGAIVTSIRLASDKRDHIPDSELPAHAQEKTAENKRSLPRRMLHAWQRFGGEMGGVQGRLIMGFFYFIILTPFAIIARLGRDPLDRAQPVGWLPRENEPPTLENAHEQG